MSRRRSAAYSSLFHPPTFRKDGMAGLAAAIALCVLLTAPGGTVGAAATAQQASTDRAALVTLYNATDGDNWTNNTNWLSSEPIGQWHGVTTNDSGRVTRLDLYRNQLSGELPAELGNLASLEALLLFGNQLSGELPQSLTGLTALWGFFFFDNPQLCAPVDSAFQSWLASLPAP